MRRTTVMMALTLLVAFAATALAASYNYLEPSTMKGWLEQGKKVQIVDIQVPEEFRRHHFKGSLETGAYPVKSAEDKQKLDRILPVLAAGTEDVVIVCPRGGGGAKNAYDHLKEKGIAESRLIVLQDGMKGWPHQELLVSGR